MKLVPRHGKQHIKYSSDLSDLVIDIGEVLDGTIATTHKRYGELDTKIELTFGTYGSYKLVVKCIEVTLPTDAYVKTITDFFPTGCCVLSLTTRVTEAITGPTYWEILYESASETFGTNLSKDLGITTDYGDWEGAAPIIMAAEKNLVIRDPSQATNFGSGKVKVCCVYLDAVPPTS